MRVLAAVRQQAGNVIDQLGEDVPPQVHVDAVSGSPAEELLAAAKEAELLVVGSRGAGGFARLAMGSVSSHVAQHAHCPVVVNTGRRPVHVMPGDKPRGRIPRMRQMNAAGRYGVSDG